MELWTEVDLADDSEYEQTLVFWFQIHWRQTDASRVVTGHETKQSRNNALSTSGVAQRANCLTVAIRRVLPGS